VRPKDTAGNRIKDAAPVLERRPWTQPQVSNFLRKARNAGLRSQDLRFTFCRTRDEAGGFFRKLDGA